MRRHRRLINKDTTEIIKLGTNYGGWFVPNDLNLNEKSIIYSAGVGEDISFDLILSSKYKSNIFLLDPTNRSIKHFDEVKKYYTNNLNKTIFTGDIQKDYFEKINGLSPIFDKINYLNIGLWDSKDELKFFKPTNKNYVSHSLIEGMTSCEYEMVKVNSIKNIMKENNHDQIDLLKLDIEGAEIKVLEQMIEDNIFPKYLLVEFDLYLQNKDQNNKTKKLIEKLENYYDILKNDNYNITFKLKIINFSGRSDGLGNRIEELIFLKAKYINNEINYYWNNKTNRSDRKYNNIIKIKNINFTDKYLKNNSIIDRDITQENILKAAKFIKFNAINNNNYGNYISIHIRKGDRLIKNMTPEYDSTYMNLDLCDKIHNHTVNLIKKQNIKNIFIASDDLNSKNKMIKELKDFNIITTNFTEDPVYNDFISLINSDKIYMCSKFSSFAITSSLIGNKKLVSYFKEDETILKRYKALVELQLLN